MSSSGPVFRNIDDADGGPRPWPRFHRNRHQRGIHAAGQPARLAGRNVVSACGAIHQCECGKPRAYSYAFDAFYCEADDISVKNMRGWQSSPCRKNGKCEPRHLPVLWKHRHRDHALQPSISRLSKVLGDRTQRPTPGRIHRYSRSDQARGRAVE